MRISYTLIIVSKPVKINSSFFRSVGESCQFIPLQFLASDTWKDTLWSLFGWSCIDSVKQTAVYSSEWSESTVRLRELWSAALPRPLQQSGSKVMFSVSPAVEGNNKNNLKWWLIHYSLSSGTAGPPLFLFSPFCLQRHFRKYVRSDSEYWVCTAERFSWYIYFALKDQLWT